MLFFMVPDLRETYFVALLRYCVMVIFLRRCKGTHLPKNTKECTKEKSVAQGKDFIFMCCSTYFPGKEEGFSTPNRPVFLHSVVLVPKQVVLVSDKIFIFPDRIIIFSDKIFIFPNKISVFPDKTSVFPYGISVCSAQCRQGFRPSGRRRTNGFPHRA